MPVALVAAAVVSFTLSAAPADAQSRPVKLSSDLTAHLDSGSTATVDVIVTGSSELVARVAAARHGLEIKQVLSSGAVLKASREALESLSTDGEVEAVSGNATVRSHMAMTTALTGAQAAWPAPSNRWARWTAAASGWRSSTAASPIIRRSPAASSPAWTLPIRTAAASTSTATAHVAGIIAARGYQNAEVGADSGMAPAAHLINLKVLGSDGTGEAAHVVAAIDFAIEYREEPRHPSSTSLGAAPTQSYKCDPMCLAVERAVKAGLVVVASAGNYGQADDGRLVYGSVTSPGISPYAITVGALRTQGTVDPLDDEVASWSLEGPDAGGSHCEA